MTEIMVWATEHYWLAFWLAFWLVLMAIGAVPATAAGFGNAIAAIRAPSDKRGEGE